MHLLSPKVIERLYTPTSYEWKREQIKEPAASTSLDKNPQNKRAPTLPRCTTKMRQAHWARWMLLLNEPRAPREQASKAALFAIALHVPTRAPQTSCASSLRAPRTPFARLHLLPSAPNISRAQRHVIESPKSITNKRADGPLPSAS